MLLSLIFLKFVLSSIQDADECFIRTLTGQQEESIEPTKYDLFLSFDTKSNEKNEVLYVGKVFIDVKMNKPLSCLYLHSKVQKVTSITCNYEPVHFSIRQYGVIKVKISEKFTNCLLEVKFNGIVKDRGNCGILNVGTTTKPILMTNFFSGWAHNLFPCFDSPCFSATFKLKIEVNGQIKAISNSIIENPTYLQYSKRVKSTASTPYVSEDLYKNEFHHFTFMETPKLPLSAVGFVMGNFNKISLGKIEVLTLRNPNTARFLLRVADFMVNQVRMIFGIHLAPSLSIVCLPDFPVDSHNAHNLIILREEQGLIFSETDQKKIFSIVKILSAKFAAQLFYCRTYPQKLPDFWVCQGLTTWLSAHLWHQFIQNAPTVLPGDFDDCTVQNIHRVDPLWLDFFKTAPINSIQPSITVSWLYNKGDFLTNLPKLRNFPSKSSANLQFARSYYNLQNIYGPFLETEFIYSYNLSTCKPKGISNMKSEKINMMIFLLENFFKKCCLLDKLRELLKLYEYRHLTKEVFIFTVNCLENQSLMAKLINEKTISDHKAQFLAISNVAQAQKGCYLCSPRSELRLSLESSIEGQTELSNNKCSQYLKSWMINQGYPILYVYLDRIVQQPFNATSKSKDSTTWPVLLDIKYKIKRNPTVYTLQDVYQAKKLKLCEILPENYELVSVNLDLPGPVRIIYRNVEYSKYSASKKDRLTCRKQVQLPFGIQYKDMSPTAEAQFVLDVFFLEKLDKYTLESVLSFILQNHKNMTNGVFLHTLKFLLERVKVLEACHPLLYVMWKVLSEVFDSKNSPVRSNSCINEAIFALTILSSQINKINNTNVSLKSSFLDEEENDIEMGFFKDSEYYAPSIPYILSKDTLQEIKTFIKKCSQNTADKKHSLPESPNSDQTSVAENIETTGFNSGQLLRHGDNQITRLHYLRSAYDKPDFFKSLLDSLLVKSDEIFPLNRTDMRSVFGFINSDNVQIAARWFTENYKSIVSKIESVEMGVFLYNLILFLPANRSFLTKIIKPRFFWPREPITREFIVGKFTSIIKEHEAECRWAKLQYKFNRKYRKRIAQQLLEL